MASISSEPNGRYTIQFVAGDGKRKSVRLGKVSQRTVDTIRQKVESLATAARLGSAIDHLTAAWLTKISDDLADKLADVGLIPRRAVARPLKEFLDAYITGRTDH